MIQKTAESTVNLTGNNITDRITKVSKTSQKNSSETVTDEHGKETPKERYTSPEGREKTIDDMSPYNSIIKEY